MGSFLISKGMHDAERSLLVEGMLPTLGAEERASYQGERFNRVPFMRVGSADIRVEESISFGGKKLIRVRGAGQFGVFRKAVSDQTDWKLSVFNDNDRTTLLAEFTG